MTDSNQNMQASDEMTLKELILLIQEYWGVLWAKKWYIIAAGLIGGLIFGIVEYRKPITYNAELTFMVNEEGGSTLSTLSGLAASFGIGSGGNSEYNLEKMIALLKSRRIIQEALFVKLDIDGHEDFIANHIISRYKFHEKWKNSNEINLVGFYFKSSKINEFNRIENLALRSIIEKIIGLNNVKPLLGTSIDDKTGIITLNTITINEELSIHLLDTLFENLSNYYIQKEIEKQKITYEISKSKSDSIKLKLDNLESKLLEIKDTRMGIKLNKYNKEKIKIEREYQTSLIAYGEALKNTELADFVLKSKTPFIQTIDRPVPPLKPSKNSKITLKAIIVGFLISQLVICLFFIFKFFIEKSIE